MHLTEASLISAVMALKRIVMLGFLIFLRKKWDIFQYTYGVLHDREYRERQATSPSARPCKASLRSINSRNRARRSGSRWRPRSSSVLTPVAAKFNAEQGPHFVFHGEVVLLSIAQFTWRGLVAVITRLAAENS
jgi:hypothetical protein